MIFTRLIYFRWSQRFDWYLRSSSGITKEDLKLFSNEKKTKVSEGIYVYTYVCVYVLLFFIMVFNFIVILFFFCLWLLYKRLYKFQKLCIFTGLFCYKVLFLISNSALLILMFLHTQCLRSFYRNIIADTKEFGYVIQSNSNLTRIFCMTLQK